MNAYERIYTPIIDDLTRRFDTALRTRSGCKCRVEAALEKMLDLDLPDWAHAIVMPCLAQTARGTPGTSVVETPLDRISCTRTLKPVEAAPPSSRLVFGYGPHMHLARQKWSKR